MKELDNLLRKINFYAKSYKMMHEVEIEENKIQQVFYLEKLKFILFEIAISIKIDITKLNAIK